MVTDLEFRYDEKVRKGNAELFNWFEADEVLMVLYFHDREDHRRWTEGEAFHLINHWQKPVKYK